MGNLEKCLPKFFITRIAEIPPPASRVTDRGVEFSNFQGCHSARVVLFSRLESLKIPAGGCFKNHSPVGCLGEANSTVILPGATAREGRCPGEKLGGRERDANRRKREISSELCRVRARYPASVASVVFCLAPARVSTIRVYVRACKCLTGEDDVDFSCRFNVCAPFLLVFFYFFHCFLSASD